MTPEIDELRAGYEAAQDAAQNARAAARDAEIALNAAVEAWATADLAERGIVMGETPVAVGQSGNRWRLDCPRVVVRVSAYGGNPSYHTAKIKKDGTPSAAGNGLWGEVVAVRPWGQA